MARTVLAHVVVSEPDWDDATECADCGFDAVAAFPLHMISESGVSPFGTYRGCVRCYTERGHL